MPLSLPQLFDLTPFEDTRGFFIERFPASLSETLGVTFLQTNHSRSRPLVLRGLHMQLKTAKLLSVTEGMVFDALWHPEPRTLKTFVLRADEPQVLYIPPGWFHGFQVLGDKPAEVLYQVTEPYRQADERGIFALDPILGIPWPEKNPLLSPRDAALPHLDHHAFKGVHA